MATVLFFGLLPALRASDTDAGHVMKGRSGQPGGGRALARFRGALIGVQVALSVLLLVLAGLFTRSLANVASVDLGMDVEPVVMFSVAPGLNGYTGERRDVLHDRITEALEAQPRRGRGGPVGSAAVRQLRVHRAHRHGRRRGSS